MANKVFLLKRDSLAPGAVCRVETSACPVAVYNIEGRFYATSDMCTHAEASLASGEIVDGDLIACPVHDGAFHIPTGRAVTFPCTDDVRTYRVIESGDEIFADLDAESDEAESAI
ncbi:non-heme iron oxygenase ferredoxin subunit [Pandoraea pulmonicola]|uniref:(2Fe-2S)-binding protein n=2 Tax=Pandoraea pulmonicola TaxID=93221 RepID=A0AAJ5D2M2_PANPU|nr:non-heme iron oxygenase ferredoxin subunit [Pandoraea pulmonicola]AJC22904.1 (2Fe-2S)-binding protein [Pandoraea pulmonicola]SUA92765.1 Toluene 1,2-dioxygenase system ferredoxin subunit [Pandoraea pulmonicola]